MNAGSTFSSLLTTIGTTAQAATSLVSAVGTVAQAAGSGSTMLLAYTENARKEQAITLALSEKSHVANAIGKEVTRQVEQARAFKALNLTDEEVAFATALRESLAATVASLPK